MRCSLCTLVLIICMTLHRNHADLEINAVADLEIYMSSHTCPYMVTNDPNYELEGKANLYFIPCSVFLPMSRGVKVSLRRARSLIRVADLVL